jgi:soluble cytochrome b562
MYLAVRLTDISKGCIITIMDELYNRLDRAVVQVNAVKSKVAKRDLIKMIRAIDTVMTAADQESVECRRVRKETPKYRELVQQVTSLIDNLEQHITFANLLG